MSEGRGKTALSRKSVDYCKTKTKKTPADGISPLDFRSALRERDFVSKLPSLVLLIPPPSCVRLYHRQAKTPVRSEPEKPSFTCSFSRHAKAQTCLALVIWLNENVHIQVRFLAMPKLKHVWLWSSGLTKTFINFPP